ncbi:putative DUF4402 domain-containing protein [Candidatus Hepatincolaceae symbiont of Richtersius coronifer]
MQQKIKWLYKTLIPSFLGLIISLNLYGYNEVKEISRMDFGTIRYKGNQAYLKMANNMLVQAEGITKDNLNIKLSEIEIKGNPNEEVEISFTPGLLYGSRGVLRLANFSIANNSVRVKLDNSGYLRFNINGDLDISSPELYGSYNGTYQIKVYYLQQKIALTKHLQATANLINLRAPALSTPFAFGTIYSQNTDCSITVGYGNYFTTTCNQVSGVKQGGSIKITGASTVNTQTSYTVNLVYTGPSGQTLSGNVEIKAQNTQTGGNLSAGTGTVMIYLQLSLIIPANIPSGMYRGTITIPVNY